MDPYLRPLANPKRVKLVSTCDVCKNRKVKCDKERPECGTCKKTNRKCSYTYATFTETIRDKQSGMKAPNESDFIQSQLDYLQKMQFGQLYDESGYLSMAARGFGTEINESQNIPGMLAMPSDVSDGTSILASEMLQYTSNVISSMPRDPEQQQYDPSYYINNDSLIQQVPEQSLYQSQQQLSPQQSPHQQMPQQPPSHQPLHQSSQEDAVMEDLITNLKNINLYESTRYIGEGNLLMVDDDNYGEIIVPQMTKDISEVDGSLKYLPDRETANQLIQLYYDHVHRYFPAIREEVVRNALKDLSKPQHWLLLNCIFFIASPFHNDPKKRDGKIHFDRAEALLYGYCTQPHALTVMSIIILGRHNKQVGSRWMYNGIATKMLFELGLHKKFKKIKMDKEIERLRIEAFWMTFISENLVSATYGRPNMIDETDCDVDVPSVPSNPNPTSEKTKLEIAYINLINLSRICARVRKYIHAASSKSKFLVQEDENKFRVLDAALASWFNNLPDWLRFEKIVKDPDGVLLNGIGGDIHIFFYTILILLHSRYMRPQVPYQHNINITNSSIICMQSATIIVHWLEILLDKHIKFFKLSTSGHLAVNPAMRVFSWHANNENSKKARDMLQRLEIIKPQIDELAGLKEGNVNFGEQKWLGIETSHSRVGNHEIYARDWEVFIRDDDKSIRKQYSLIARKQTGGHFMPRKGSRSMSGSSSMNYTRGIKTNNSQDFNFTFKTDQTFDFSAFSSGQNFNLPQLTVFSEPEQLENQNNQQHYHTPLQQSPQQQYQQFQSQHFNTPLNQSSQSQSQQKYNSPLEQSQHTSQGGMELRPPHIDTSSFKLMSDDQQNKFNNNNVLWTPPQSARSQLWKQPNVNDLPSNTLAATSLSMANTMLTPPMQPQDLFLDDLAADELWNALQNENNNIDFGNALNYDNNSGHGYNGHDDGHDSVGLGISMGNNNNNIQ